MAATVVGVTVVGGFTVGDAHLVGFTDPVDPVYPPGFIKSICGPVICGDGHLCLGQPSGQFGAVSIAVSFAQTRTVGAVASAQQFGTVKTAFGINVPGVGSAQQFGTVRFRVSAPTLGLDSEQQFGVPSVAQGRPVTGLGSAQQFGTIRVSAPVRPAGVPSAQQFGTLKANVVVAVSGLDTAQRFGAVTFRTGPVTIPIAGVLTAQQFGTTAAGLAVFNVYLHPEVCLEDDLEQLFCLASPDDTICGWTPDPSNPTICGDGHVCGGASFDRLLACLTDEGAPIVYQFLCGQKQVGGHVYSLPSLPTMTLDLPAAPPLVLDMQPAGVS